MERRRKKLVSLDQQDQVCFLKAFQETLLNNIVIRGIKDIKQVTPRTINNTVEFNTETCTYDKKEIYVLDTVGSNLLDVLKLSYIDPTRTFSNNVTEMYKVLGIEATRKLISDELTDVIEAAGETVDEHHIEVLCDRMTCNKKLVSIYRHGIKGDDIGPIAKATFEETSEMFLKAARHGELDEMRGVSANVMCGQTGYFGTSSFQVYLNTNAIQQMDELDLTSTDDTEQFNLGTELGECSASNVKITNNTGAISTIDLGQDDDYELDI